MDGLPIKLKHVFHVGKVQPAGAAVTEARSNMAAFVAWTHEADRRLVARDEKILIALGSRYKYFTSCNSFPCKCVRGGSLASFNMLERWWEGFQRSRTAVMTLNLNSHKTSLCSL